MRSSVTPNPFSSETYSEGETELRREAALKRLLTTPHKPHDNVKNANCKKG